MKKQLSLHFGMPHLYAIGAGITAAVLFSLARQGTLAAMILANLAPLPIMIATLACGALSGLGAALLAAVTVGVLTLGELPRDTWPESLPVLAIAGLIFIATLGLPAWGLSVIAAIDRSIKGAFWKPVNTPLGPGSPASFFPLSSITAFSVFAATTIVAGTILFVTIRHGNFEAAVDSAVDRLSPLTEHLLGHEIELPGGFEIPDLARILVLAAAPAMAASIFLMFMLNLWLAARAVQVSGRLARPWPDIPRSLYVPRTFTILLAAAIGGAFLGGFPGMISASLASGLGMAFALQGLAAAHDLSRGKSFRTPMLSAIYAALILLMPWPLALFALIGILESIFLLRDRKAAALSKV